MPGAEGAALRLWRMSPWRTLTNLDSAPKSPKSLKNSRASAIAICASRDTLIALERLSGNVHCPAGLETRHGKVCTLP